MLHLRKRNALLLCAYDAGFIYECMRDTLGFTLKQIAFHSVKSSL
jgi:hypothetical protein